MKKQTVLWFFLIPFIFSIDGFAQSLWSQRQGPSSIRQKSDAKYKDVWSLSDWFDSQRKTRLMDQWLAMNSSSTPFEFYLMGQTTQFEQKVDLNGSEGIPEKFNIYRGTLGAFATITGLQVEYTDAKDNYDQFEGTFQLRLLGRSQQGTNLTGFVGVSSKTYSEKSFTTQKEKVRQNLAGGSMTLNLTKFFGIKGLYKSYFKHKTSLGNETYGDRIEGTAFIDFYFIRLYGTWFQETESYTNKTSLDKYKIQNRGILGGLGLFF